MFSAFCKEDAPEMMSYAKHFVKEMEDLQEMSFRVEFVREGEKMQEEIKFRHARFCGDQKFEASLLGELNNAATYPFR